MLHAAKGYRTIIINAVMLVTGLMGMHYTPEMAQQVAEGFIAAWAIINFGLRLLTDTPPFKKEKRE